MYDTTPPSANRQPTERPSNGTHRHRKAVLQKLRLDLSERRTFEIQCFYCSDSQHVSWDGKTVSCIDTAQFDHVMPLVLGGCDCPCNIVVSCGSCNAMKGSMAPFQWLIKLERGGHPNLPWKRRSRIVRRLIAMEKAGVAYSQWAY